MKVKDAINKLSSYTLSKMTEKEVRDLYSNIQRSITQRRNAFRRAGDDVFGAFKKEYKGKQKSAKEFEKDAAERGENAREEMESYISNALAWMRGTVSTAKGMSEFIEQRRKELKDRFDIPDATDQQLHNYLNFMNSMEKRYGAAWKYESALAYKLAKEATRLNINPETLKANFEYWADHLEDLENVQAPLTTGRQMRASEARSRLNLEKIADWRSRQ